ncbi:unnamed protein product [Brugia timori]|uniref:G_PROTEIN_RECEP_F1_2 domain-containing protein n=1 Tax=Brugia timori TaxID=42155 RepID=A0A3P7WN13_9BILA|nr:unnamed protein product [Brugia timori]
MVGKEVEISVNILINCFVIFSAAILPTANLIFVKRFRESVKQTLVKLFSKIKVMKRMFTLQRFLMAIDINDKANIDSVRKRLSISKMVAYYYCITVLLSILPLNCHAENVTNVFDIRDERNTVERYVAVVLFSLLLLYSIVSNVLLIFEFCRRDNLYNHSFVLITSQLIVCNLSISLLQVLFILPEILQNKDNSNGKLFYLSILHSHLCYIMIPLF